MWENREGQVRHLFPINTGPGYSPFSRRAKISFKKKPALTVPVNLFSFSLLRSFLIDIER